MAWKKIVVSGSTAQLSTLNVDSTVVADQLSGSFSGSFAGDGSNITGVNVGQLSTVSSAFTSQTSVTVNHNFDSEDVHVSVYDNNNQLIIPSSTTVDDADNVTIALDTSTTGRVVVSRGGHLLSGSIEFANILNKPADIVSSSAQIAVDISGSFVSASDALGTRIDNITSTISLAGDSGTDTYTTGETLTFAGDNSITTTVTDNTVTFTIGDGVVSGSSIASSAQGEVALTTNGVAATAVDLGLKTDDDVTFATVTTTGDVTIAGDLNVTGDTIQASVSNLNVEDKFILINSGSATGDAGIVFGGAGGSTANTGDGIFYDDSDSVFAFGEDIASTATTATNSSKLGNIEVDSSNPSSAPTFQGIGTIHINDSDEGIWIYS